MLHKVLKAIDSKTSFPVAAAHCDIPCGIYDPITAQLAALSCVRFLDQINELGENDSLDLAQQAKLSRLVTEKEAHAAKVKDEIRVIWGDYMKGPQFEQFPEMHQLVHRIMLAGGAVKQHIDRANGEKLVSLVNDFAEAFWTTKGVETYVAECPYPPAMDVVYPKLA